MDAGAVEVGKQVMRDNGIKLGRKDHKVSGACISSDFPTIAQVALIASDVRNLQSADKFSMLVTELVDEGVRHMHRDCM